MLVRTLFPILVLTSTAAAQELRLPAVFSDHMVVQRDTNVRFWGWGGGEVSLRPSWLDEPITAMADVHRTWSVEVPTPRAGGPHTILVQMGDDQRTLTDVWSGEVWLCSGQSNMEWPVRAADKQDEVEAYASRGPRIRLFTVKNAIARSPELDCAGAWLACTPESAANFSAVGFQFGRRLHDELDVPIGLIAADWGGTRVESWTSAGKMAEFAEYRPALDMVLAEAEDPEAVEQRYAAALAQWSEKVTVREAGAGAGSWAKADFDDSAWEAMAIPGLWDDTPLGGFDGFVWYRRAFELPEEWAKVDLTLSLGAVDDEDVTFVNGKRVGGLEGAGHWATPRHYTVPASVTQPGRNVIAVRVLDTGGAGGFSGKGGSPVIAPAGAHRALGLGGAWRYKASLPLGDVPRRPSRGTFDVHSPTALFNGMIAPLVPYGIRGAIWYQGESNRNVAKRYAELFPGMIQDWRKQWGIGDFPFYFVQIAPFNYGGPDATGELREAQRAALRTANTGMVVTLDIGNPRDIHPRNKYDVGARLARWALAKTYGKDGVICSGPLYRSLERERGALRVAFDYVGEGLEARGELVGFEVAGGDGVYRKAEAQIDGASVIVRSTEVPEPLYVRYAWGDSPVASLFNVEGLPAAPFVGEE